MKCLFHPISDNDDRGWRTYRCPLCGRRVQSPHPPELIHALCRGPSFRLGDKLEWALALVGITQERYVAWKVRNGGSAGCNCPARREWLNRVGWLNNVTSSGWWLNKILTPFRG